MSDERTEVLMSVLRPLLLSLESLSLVARHIQPSNLSAVVGHVGEPDKALAAARTALGENWPEGMGALGERIDPAIDAVQEAFGRLRRAAGEENGIGTAYRALRRNAEAQEAIYPLAGILPPVNWFFLDSDRRDDAAFRERLMQPPQPNTGLMYAGDRAEGRGTWLYVPEYVTPDREWPLVMALHGGSGTGRSFIWSWLRAARSRGCILVAPSSLGQTWALQGEDVDTPDLRGLLAAVREQWSIDPAHMLLTGMSDGGTFCYVSGLDDGCPFTHLAPVSAAFHPMLAEFADAERVRGLPVHIIHGALDWMFPLQMARLADEYLRARGANVMLRQMADLPHTWPSDMTGVMLDWFLGD